MTKCIPRHFVSGLLFPTARFASFNTTTRWRIEQRTCTYSEGYLCSNCKLDETSRSKLWGPDANEFNPDRVWQDEEIWGSHFPLGGFNPASDRYSPFTFAPRDCMGKNFAQMQMRVILCSLFRRFSFDLAPPTSTFDRKTFLGVNRATLGPQDIGVDPSKPARLGLYLRLTPRYL